MYYVRTADRLQRTAAWVEDHEGGLEAIAGVVIDDSLGIGADLDAAMAAHVDGYVDEWAATLADPEKRAQFVSFVNALRPRTRASAVPSTTTARSSPDPRWRCDGDARPRPRHDLDAHLPRSSG